MVSPFCEGRSPFDLGDICVQTLWSAGLPVLLATAFYMISIPISPTMSRAWDCVKAPLRDHISLEEAETLTLRGAPPYFAPEDPVERVSPTRCTTSIVWIAFFEVFLWTTRGVYESVRSDGQIRDAICFLVIGTTWLYAALKPARYPKETAYVDLFILYTVHLIFGIITLGGALYHFHAHATWVQTVQWIGILPNVFAVATGLWRTSRMPMKIPPDAIKNDVYVTRSPENFASIFELATYSWVYPLIKRGSMTDMQEDDVWDLSPAMQSRPVFIKFSTLDQPTLLRRLIVANSRDLILDILLTFLTVTLSYGLPYSLRNILDSINDPTPEHRSRAYVHAFLLCFCALMKGVADTQHLFFGNRASARVRVQLMDAIYEKALKRRDFSGAVSDDTTQPGDADNTNTPKQNANVGRAVNLMSIDANKISMIVGSAYLLYGGPLEITLALAFLFNLLGFAAFAGLLTVLIGWVLHIYIIQIGIQIQKELSTSRDNRMSVLDGLVKAVKYIKFLAWEDWWIRRVLVTREAEMGLMKLTCINSIFAALIWVSAPILVSVTSFLVYVHNGHELTASVAFTSISLMAMLRQSLNIFPSFLVQVFQTRVSLERVEAFLDEEEVPEQVSSFKRTRVDSDDSNGEEDLFIERGYFRWESNQNNIATEHQEQNGRSNTRMPSSAEAGIGRNSGERIIQSQGTSFELRDISVRFPEEKLSLITGPTGCGKTALLLALLGEMSKVRGKLNVPKDSMQTISYAAQRPWLQHRTIKENILFGNRYDEQRYNDVVECCALYPDLNILEDGDETLVGDRGINLSGGQKARVALARAVYADTKYVLLDDPLSAVDSKTRTILFEQLLCGPLLQHRTVILVTRHLDLVRPQASFLVRMLDGCIVENCPLKSATDMSHFPQWASEGVGQQGQRPTGRPPTIFHIQDDSMEKGGIRPSAYMTYLAASNYWMWCLVAFLIVCSQCMGVAEKLWIREWDQAYQMHQGTTVRRAIGDFNIDHWLKPVTFPDARDQPFFYVKVYAVIGSVTVFLSVGSTIMQCVAALAASRSLFSRLLRSVVHATMHWCDVTPSGRLLNCFGKDIDVIDSTLSDTMFTVGTSLASFAVAVLTISAFFPTFLVPVTFIATLYCMVAKRYLNISRQLRRMESTSRSTIFSGFGELLEGIVTIRAFSAEHRFMEEFHKKNDVAIKMYYNSWMANQWLLLNFDVLGAFAILMTTLLTLSEYVPAGTAGLCITSAMSFTMSVSLACRSWTALELDLKAVERVAEYLDIDQEPPRIIELNRPPAYWPFSRSGQTLVSIENLSVRYARDLPLVLHNISLTLNGGECIGVIGRSGSGKSTLAMSMLRFVDPSPGEGRIVIDGIDISTIGVHDLRSRLAYIPENPVLFSGTLRENIDPFGEHDDHECEDILRRVQLFDNIVHDSRHSSSKAVITLCTQVAPGGNNFSQGQRQLIAIARTLLRRCTVIILEEAPSSMDFEIASKIQATIRDYYSQSLLITITHRLRSIIDYDRWIVLYDGEVTDFDTPFNLIKQKGDFFRTVSASQPDALIPIARDSNL